jgi:hypothetical protein
MGTITTGVALEMAVPVVLNETSYLAWPDDGHEGAECIARVSEVLRDLAKLRRSVFLLTDERVGDIFLGQRTLREYLDVGVIRDSIRQILVFANRSPLSSFSDLDADGAECFVGDVPAKGILYAHMMRTISISFPTNVQCRNSSISAKFIELSQDGSSLVEQLIDTANAALSEHVLVHSQVISAFREAEVSTGLDLWNLVGEWFPSLRFLPRVETDLRAFLKASVPLDQVVDRLFELEATISEWNSEMGPPIWRSKVTPESESRRSFCNFLSLEGVIENYELHARYTPGVGRIHFRLLPNHRQIEVAYIGTKLGA